MMKRDNNKAAGEDADDDEGGALTHQAAGATKGTSHEGTGESKTMN
jgi:hypothetical protein